MKESGLDTAARVAVRQCLAVQPSEQVVVVFDAPCQSIARALWNASRDVGTETLLIEMTPRAENGMEPPTPVAAAMSTANVVFAPASKSITHTEARRSATAAGARVATLPGITESIFSRTLVADYEAIRKRTEAIASRIRGKNTVRITTPAGTDITFSIAGRSVMLDTGILREPGITNLPAGEAFLAPVEGSGEGVIAVDGSIGESGILTAPIMFEVRNGLVSTISGHPYAEKLMRAMEAAGPEARNLAELGIGTNDSAQLVGHVLEDEKILGTVHLAFGDNRSMGGSVRAPFHQDGILLRPSMWVDDEQVMRDGEFITGGK